MFPYYLLLFLPILVSLLCINKKNKKLPITIFFIIFVGMLIFRSIKCGIDLTNYYVIYKNDSQMTLQRILEIYSLKGEVGYHLFNYLMSKMNVGFQTYIGIIAVFSTIPLYLLYRRDSDNAILTLLLFVTVSPFNMFFSGLRQVMAISIMIIGFRYVKEKKIIPFVITIILAMQFHNTAVITFLLYPIYHANISKKWLIIVIPLMFILFIFRENIFNIVLHYSNMAYQERYGYIQSTGAYSILILLILFAVYSYIIPDEKKFDRETIGLRNILLLCICIQMFASINNVIMRLNYYFLMFIPILIPKLIKTAKTNYKSIAQFSNIVLVVFFLFYFYWNAYRGNDVLNIYPYIPYWKG